MLTGGNTTATSGVGAVNLAETLFKQLQQSGSRRSSLNKDKDASCAAAGALPEQSHTARRHGTSDDEAKLAGGDGGSSTGLRLRTHASADGVAGGSTTSSTGASVGAVAAARLHAAEHGSLPPQRRLSEKRSSGERGGASFLPLVRGTTFTNRKSMIPLGRQLTTRKLGDGSGGLDGGGGGDTPGTHRSSHPGSRRSSRLSQDSSDDGRGGGTDDPTAQAAEIEGMEAAAVELAKDALRRAQLEGDGVNEAELAVQEAIRLKQAKQAPISRFGTQVLALIDSVPGTIVMTLATFFCLFGDDIRQMTVPREGDLAFVVLSVICLVAFAVEFAAFTKWKAGYIWSFFFFLDLIAVFSLIPDLPFIWDPFMESIGQSDSGSQNLAVARAGRASRAGTRAGRLVRFVRLVRFLRLAKLWKYLGNETAEQRKEREEHEQMEEMERLKAEQEERLIAQIDSEIGKGFSDYITKCVIIIVLILMFVLPLLEVAEADTTLKLFVDQMDGIMNDAATILLQGGLETVPAASTLAADVVPLSQLWLREPSVVYGLTDRLLSNDLYTLVYVSILAPGAGYASNASDIVQVAYLFDESRLDALRNSEVQKTVGVWVTLFADVKASRVTEAGFSLGATVFVTVLLGVGAMYFSKDAHSMVILPIERMFLFVTRLASNPLGKIEPTGALDQPFETRLLETTFLKLAGLLQVGFGAAGAEVISHNMHGDFLDPMVPGRKIFGQLFLLVPNSCSSALC
jgi:hypothetical protein